MYWHCLAGEVVYPVRIAVNFKIPLIVWGVHQGIDQVGMFSHNDMVEMNRRYRIEHDLMGIEAESLIDKNKHFNKKNLYPYIYPHDNELEKLALGEFFKQLCMLGYPNAAQINDKKI